ncbi:sigma-70 family RNA polymerase sigma factor [Peribacillus sp. SCS-26]|uniref:sigma-70 family RNA polymerase sigma factor n=1 Tax=Paraperibacillus marinus TaxID=3115295 RepID=UPI003905868A
MTERDIQEISSDMRKLEHEYKQRIEPFRQPLWQYCYKLTRSPWDAEDLVQETLLRSLSLLSKVFQEMNVKAYLFRIAANVWIDQQRKKKIVSEESYEVEWIKDPGNPFNTIENLEWLARNLTPREYVAILLVDVFQFKAEEAGSMIGTPRGAVYASLNRAREVLKEIQKSGPEVPIKRKVSGALHGNQVVGAMLEGFRRKDPAVIAALLDENVVVDITHAGVEMGKDETLKNSLKDWQETAAAQGCLGAEYIILWGRPVIIEYEVREGVRYLNNIHYVEIENNVIVYWKFYCFSWELLQAAAHELESGLNAKYFQHIF